MWGSVTECGDGRLKINDVSGGVLRSALTKQSSWPFLCRRAAIKLGLQTSVNGAFYGVSTSICHGLFSSSEIVHRQWQTGIAVPEDTQKRKEEEIAK